MKKLFTLLALGLLGSICSLYAETVKLGRTIPFEATSTLTEYTILTNNNAVVTLADGNGGEILSNKERAFYCKSDKVSIFTYHYRNKSKKNSGAVISAFDSDTYAGFKIEIPKGYKITVSNIYAKVAVGDNFTYKIILTDGNNAIYTSQEKAITNYSNKKSATNTEATITPSSTITLKGTVYVRLHYWVPNQTNNSKYLIPLDLSVNGDLVEDDTQMPTATLAASGMGTFCSTMSCKVPEGLTAYTASVSGSTASLTAVEDGIIPANTGVVLSGTPSQTYTMLPTTEVTASWENNQLSAATTATEISNTNTYVLINNNNNKGQFAKLKSGETIPAGKAYLTLTDQNAGANFLTLDFGTETAIKNVEVKRAADDNYYSLDGKKIVKPQHGAYIHNGKVYVAK